ncbi:testis-expressed protein 101 [Lepus europaeus]|uniref:testis-expressed protein 101 n=1 Tax=Lepus europaeus TaxID=9983 RepID=UPI002B48644C|nr:testis-expressed protein 101 [Lepus europaeus]
MGAFRVRDSLCLLLLGASLTLAHNLNCQKSLTVRLGGDLSNTFNWTTEEVETCDNGAICQESILIITAGTRTVALGSKGCIFGESESVTFIQHSAPPGLVALSYSNYCDNLLCNNREAITHFGNLQLFSGSSVPSAFRCPTCLALGSCSSAPYLPCVNGTSRCYQGKLSITGGDMNESVEVKGCTDMKDCRLMGRITTVGPMLIKETCSLQSFPKPRVAENGSRLAAHFSFGVRATAAIAAAITCPFFLRRYFWSWVSRRFC